MILVRSLGYLVLGVADLERWTRFALDILGMAIGRRHDDGSLGLRMDEHEQRLLLQSSAADEVLAYGWETADEGDLLRLVEHLRSRGCQVDEGDPASRRQRGVHRLFRTPDPVHPFMHELTCAARIHGPTQPFRSSVATGGFQAGPLGCGHVALTSPQYARSVDFYANGLGLGISGYADVAVPGGRFEATFFHGSGGRHHSLALLDGPPLRPTRHLMVEYQHLDDVGLAYERCLAHGIPIERALGVHEGDGMFSFYAVTPSGFLMEIGYGGLTATSWQPVTLTALSRWGHQKPLH